ncbi:regulator of nonsense transcripts 3A-like isoform X2 [Prorops nasuta]
MTEKIQQDNKKEKCRPMTKVVIRRLPPTMTQEQFLEQVSPLPEHDYLYFAKADLSLGQFAFTRAYINFIDQQDIFIFREKFDNYVFVDGKGTEYSAVVEFAPFQRLPKKRIGKKKDLKCGTIELDSYYISFLENLKNQETDSNVAQPKTEYSYQPSDNTSKKITTTPLLEYVKQRRQEKQRHRDEKREERRRRDLERRRTKDDPIISKVLKNPDLEKDESKDNKENKEDKEKISPKDIKTRNKREDKIREKISRDRDSKSLGKTYREDWGKDAKHQRRQEERRLYGRRDERENIRDERKDIKDERRYEFKDDKETKDKKFEEKRGKSYEKMRLEKKRLAETKKQSSSGGTSSSQQDSTHEKDEEVALTESAMENTEDISSTVVSSKVTRDSTEIEKQNVETEETPSGTEKSKSNEHINNEAVCDNESDDKKVVKRRSSLESCGEGGTGDGNCLRRHKSLDGGEQNNLQKSENEDKEKDKKDPRLERRIRNKDRPAMEIYRPGMGKFSKQRLEREKSSNDERSSLSQSPTPSGAASVSKTGKPGNE